MGAQGTERQGRPGDTLALGGLRPQGALAAYPSAARALRNIRIQGPSSPRPGGRQESCTARKTRSGWGMRMVTRPSGVVTAVIPPGEPLGFSG